MQQIIQKQTMDKSLWMSSLAILFAFLVVSTSTNASSLKKVVTAGSQTLTATNIPAVIANLPLNEWQAISLNTIKDVDPCPGNDNCAWSAVEGLSGVVNDWTGGAYASEEGELGGLVYFGGGHNGYYGNEVYFFNLETLLWERRGEPTDGQTPENPNTFGLNSQCRFWDGKPLAIHTYESVFYDPLQNSFWLSKVSDAPSSSPGSPSGCSSDLPAAFSLDTNSWRDSGTSPVGSKFSATAWDATRELAWVVDQSGSRVHSFDPVLDVWQTYVGGFPLNIDFTAAIDPIHDLLVFANFRNGTNKVGVKDLNSLNDNWFLVNTTGDTSIEGNTKVGFEWAPQLGGFIAWKEGLDLFLLTPPASDPRNNPWVWSRINATGVTPDTPVNGPYSKFQYVPELGIALVASSVTGSVFAIRLAGTTDQVKLYDTFTLSLDRPGITGNKFFEFPQVIFSKGAKTFLVEGFYYGNESGTADGSIWKARFMPDEIGQWDYSWDFNGETGSGSFDVIGQSNDLIHGHVKRAGRFLATDDGQGFLYRGSNWPDTRRYRVNEGDSSKTFITKADWVNYVTRLLETNHNGTYMMAMDRMVNDDRTSFALPWLEKVDFALEQAGTRGIYVFLGIFNTWTRSRTDAFVTETNSSNQILDPWNNNLMLEKEFYLRYLAARFAGYYNTLWELGNEVGHSNSGSDFRDLANDFYIPWLRQYDPYAIPITLSENQYQQIDVEIGGLHQGQTIGLNETQPIIHTELVGISGATDVLWGGAACRNPTNRKYYRRTAWRGFIEGGSGSIECSLPFSGSNAFPEMDDFLADSNITNVMEDHGRLGTAVASFNNDLLFLIPTTTSVLGTSSSSFKMRAKNDEEYVAYFWGGLGSGATISLNIPTGNYFAQWISPSSGQTSVLQSVSTGNSITSPWSNEYDAMLHVYAESGNLTSVSLSASNSQVNSGETVTLTWNSSNTNSCEASGGWSGSRATSGSESSPAITNTTTFTLTCMGDTGSSSDSVTINVVNTDPVVSLSASSTLVDSGDTITLSWNSINTNSCVASGGWSGSRGVSGSEISPAITTTTNFVLTCSGNAGSSIDTVTVSIDNGGAISLGSGLIITNALVYDENNGNDWSISANLQIADSMYGDRSFSFSQIPANLIGQEWLSTANDSKSFVGEKLVEFSVAVNAEVFILHRDDIPNKPDWLSSWIDTGNDVINDEPKTYSIFSRSFNAGEQVSLGSNGSASSGMYIVVVAPINQGNDSIFTDGFEL
ncbi:MAG: DUF5060 domain-containing protein [Xanthomonadales bacterium]|nr:DUF5060 domain-containing protein [Xanthomonadales bacterium]